MFKLTLREILDEMEQRLRSADEAYRIRGIPIVDYYNLPDGSPILCAVGLEAEPLREFIATGAGDNEVAAWMSTHAQAPREKIIKWGCRFRMNPLWRMLEFEDWLHQRGHGRMRG